MSKLSKEQETLAAALTTLQRSFAINLKVHLMTQRQAYVEAGGKAKTESDQDASASRMSSNVKVKAFIDSFIVQEVSSAIMTRDEALKRITLAAQVTITDVCDFREVEVRRDAKDKPIYETHWTIKKDMSPAVAACIKSVKTTAQGIQVEIYDSLGAIKQLATMQGWDADQKFVHDVNVVVSEITRTIVD